MKQETILRISDIGSAVSATTAAGSIAKLINNAFESKNPEYSLVEIETSDGVISFRKGTYKTITSDLVFRKFSDRRYYADQERAERLVGGLRSRHDSRLGPPRVFGGK